MQASISVTIPYPDDFSQLQSFVNFDDGNGNTFTRSYTFPVGSDPLAQIQADVDAYNAATQAVATFTDTIQTAIAARPEFASIAMAGVSQPALGLKTAQQTPAA